MTVVSPAETPRNPWGLSKTDTCSLASVMDEELAKELQDKDGFLGGNGITTLERPVDSIVEGIYIDEVL